MFVLLIIAIGAFAAVSGVVRLALVGRAYRSARSGTPDSTAFDRDCALTLTIQSITAIIGGAVVVSIGLALDGILVF
ncbi:hypothetical protein HWV23_10070 [Natronomonas halophila]|uniref:hypothetical protein n=1 Tax=Natronomonas halophila TaxID=2747817 RepID=UPI0015B54039|nr:hypothetical protein [Natronomonas halophila]QLD86057.1 hypothetical protein HWV23_10070 [Natronomonas halophila]